MPPDATDPARLNILAVDDEAGSRTALDVVLKLAGHHATFAASGLEALKLFDQAPTPFDLVITDHQMLQFSGLDLVRTLRGKGFDGEVVVLTAYADTFEEAEYRKLEVAGVMEKPFDVAELRTWIGAIETHQQKRHANAPAEPVHCRWVKQPRPFSAKGS